MKRFKYLFIILAVLIVPVILFSGSNKTIVTKNHGLEKFNSSHKSNVVSVNIYRFNPNHSENTKVVVNAPLENISKKEIKAFSPGKYEKFIFIGAYSDKNYKNKLNSDFEISRVQNKEVYFKWERSKIKIKLVFEPDYSIFETYEINYGENFTLPSQYTKNGYNAICWIDDKNQKYFFGQTIFNIQDDIQLNIKWELIKYNIIYENLDGAKNYNKTKYTILDDIYFVELQKTGYEFLGFYLEKEFINKIIKIPKGTCGDKTLYAKWRISFLHTRDSVYTIYDISKFRQPHDDIDISYYTGKSMDYLNSKYSKIKIEISLRMWELYDGYQYIFLLNGTSQNAKILTSRIIEHGSGYYDGEKRIYSFSYECSLSNLDNSNIISLFYEASGFGYDTWENDNLKVKVVIE